MYALLRDEKLFFNLTWKVVFNSNRLVPKHRFQWWMNPWQDLCSSYSKRKVLLSSLFNGPDLTWSRLWLHPSTKYPQVRGLTGSYEFRRRANADRFWPTKIYFDGRVHYLREPIRVNTEADHTQMQTSTPSVRKWDLILKQIGYHSRSKKGVTNGKRIGMGTTPKHFTFNWYSESTQLRTVTKA